MVRAEGMSLALTEETFLEKAGVRLRAQPAAEEEAARASCSEEARIASSNQRHRRRRG